MSIRPIQELSVDSMTLNLKLNRLNINKSKQNQIKVNRKRLPSDFFGKSSQKTDRSSSRDKKKEYVQKMLQTKRKFFSQKKINAPKQLNQFKIFQDVNQRRQIDPFNNQKILSKVLKLKLDKDYQQNDKKKSWRKTELKTFRFQKKIEDINPYQEGLLNNQFSNFNFKSKQFSKVNTMNISNLNISRNNSSLRQNPQILDMNCTFGKKFNKSIISPASHQNILQFKQSKQIQEEIQIDSRFNQESEIFHYEREKKQKEEKSTEESSQIFSELSKYKRINHTSQKCSFNHNSKEGQLKQSKGQQKRFKLRRNSLVDKGINLPKIVDRQDRIVQF